MQTNKPLKPKNCKNCGNRFTPQKPLQVVCGITCIIEWTMKLKEKKERKRARQEATANRQAILKLKPKGYYQKQAQAALNAWIVKVRDKGLPCVSCGKFKPAYEAGHYLARSIRKELSLVEKNLANQCYYCNHYSKNAHHDYRKGLIARIGMEEVEKLEAPHPPVKHSIDDLKEITKKYRQLLRDAKDL